ncbi:MAG: M48 family metallopeptidase [Chitinophagaceae bacterium]
MRTIAFLMLFVILLSCQKNSITGRKQLLLVPETELQQMSDTQYRSFLIKNKVVAGKVNRDAEMVNRVGKKISEAITQYYSSKGMASKLNGYKWEFNLVDDKTVNAWCMPGGKVVVYTGLLSVTQNEKALAVVMGHEIAHAIAQHGNERMSQGLLQQFGGVALSVAVSNKPSATQDLFLNAYGMASSVGVILPYSRKQELEADRYGLQFSAMAGYDPREAVPFWERMSKMADGQQKPPEFLSTHPSDQSRIEKVKEYVTEAIKYYK